MKSIFKVIQRFSLQIHNSQLAHMLGNDDLLSVDNLFEQTCGGFANVHNIAGKKIRIDEYEFIGMNQILDHPFGCKDRVVTETDYIPQRQLSLFAGISNDMVMTEFLTGWSIPKQHPN